MQYCTTFGQPITTCIYLLNENNDKGALRINKYFFFIWRFIFYKILVNISGYFVTTKMSNGKSKYFAANLLCDHKWDFIKRHTTLSSLWIWVETLKKVAKRSHDVQYSRSLINTSLISTVLEITTFFKMAFLD